MDLSNKKLMLNHKISSFVFMAVKTIEICLAGLLVLLVILSSLYFIATLVKNHTKLVSYSDFQQLLSFLLLLIIALELAHMLIEHKSNNVIEVMIYAIARKMLIYNTTALEMLISVITLALLFAVKKYFVQDKPRFLRTTLPFIKKNQEHSKRNNQSFIEPTVEN